MEFQKTKLGRIGVTIGQLLTRRVIGPSLNFKITLLLFSLNIFPILLQFILHWQNFFSVNHCNSFSKQLIGFWFDLSMFDQHFSKLVAIYFALTPVLHCQSFSVMFQFNSLSWSNFTKFFQIHFALSPALHCQSFSIMFQFNSLSWSTFYQIVWNSFRSGSPSSGSIIFSPVGSNGRDSKSSGQESFCHHCWSVWAGLEPRAVQNQILRSNDNIARNGRAKAKQCI